MEHLHQRIDDQSEEHLTKEHSLVRVHREGDLPIHRLFLSTAWVRNKGKLLLRNVDLCLQSIGG